MFSLRENCQKDKQKSSVCDIFSLKNSIKEYKYKAANDAICCLFSLRCVSKFFQNFAKMAMFFGESVQKIAENRKNDKKERNNDLILSLFLSIIRA